MTISKQQLTDLIDELIKRGEDSSELNLWLDIFDTMDEAAQSKLIDNLQHELEQLKQLESK